MSELRKLALELGARQCVGMPPEEVIKAAEKFMNFLDGKAPLVKIDIMDAPGSLLKPAGVDRESLLKKLESFSRLFTAAPGFSPFLAVGLMKSEVDFLMNLLAGETK